MWVITDEEMVKLQNRMNDLWEEKGNNEEFIRCADRLLGALDMISSPDHYYVNKKDQ